MHVYKNEIYTHLGDYDGFAFWIHLRINDNYDRNINKSLYEYLSKKSGLPLTLGIYDVKIMLCYDDDGVRTWGYDFLYYEHNSVQRNSFMTLECLEYITKSLLEDYNNVEKCTMLLYKLEPKIFEEQEDEEIFNVGYKLLRNINTPDNVETYYV